MNRCFYRSLAVVLLIGSGLIAATPHPIEAAGCGDPGMMGDEMMDDSTMMGDEMMDPGMMSDPMMDSPAMMADQMLPARDGQCLASQPAAVQAAFVAVWGDQAGARWVQEHEAELSRSGM